MAAAQQAAPPEDHIVVSAESSPSCIARSPAAKRHRTLKSTRACDFCKQRKAKCSGTIPCDKCARRGRLCQYDAKYSRGHPPTPRPSATATVPIPGGEGDGDEGTAPSARPSNAPLPASQGPASRASPELGLAEIGGQIFDPTSGFTFLERARQRLTRPDQGVEPSDAATGSAERQLMVSAGDRPLPQLLDGEPPWLSLPSDRELHTLMSLYFDVCIATYRVVHRPSVESWLTDLVGNIHHQRSLWHDIGHARAALVLAALAIATAHQDKSAGFASAEAEEASLHRSDRLFCASSRLTEGETGFPKLESAQARIVQVLYLLTTSRMNQAWFTFGAVLQIVSALGMHRRASRHRRAAIGDYVQEQCRLRTFWTAYILDKYLGVIFGRPQHFHDDDVNQDLPESIDDDDMTPQGPRPGSECPLDTYISALVFHARLAQIISSISRQVYSTKAITQRERAAAAQRLNGEVRTWRASLPPHLGSIRPSMLIQGFRRQATVLKLAYSHAIMHANRHFLLGSTADDNKSQPQIAACLGAAMEVLEMVDHMASEGPIFHAFWWTQYVTFCALLAAYVWDMQRKRRGPAAAERLDLGVSHSRLMVLAERCHTHLAKATATNSPSRRYAIILEELRSEAAKRPGLQAQDGTAQGLHRLDGGVFENQNHIAPHVGGDALQGLDMDLADKWPWQTTDWLELDSSAYGLHDFDSNATFHWTPNLGG